jgi:hypothetical protein
MARLPTFDPFLRRRLPRSRAKAALAAGALLFVGLLAGCSALQQFAALRQVDFSLDRVSDVRIAGVRLEGKDSYSDLSAIEIARLGAAAVSREVPLDLVVHVQGENPASNGVEARLLELDWTLFLENRKTVSGEMNREYAFPSGETVDVPIDVRLDLVDFFEGNAADLFELALAVAGEGEASADVRLEAVPTVETALGRIRYPGSITIVRKTVGVN